MVKCKRASKLIGGTMTFFSKNPKNAETSSNLHTPPNRSTYERYQGKIFKAYENSKSARNPEKLPIFRRVKKSKLIWYFDHGLLFLQNLSY